MDGWMDGWTDGRTDGRTDGIKWICGWIINTSDDIITCTCDSLGSGSSLIDSCRLNIFCSSKSKQRVNIHGFNEGSQRNIRNTE